MTVIAFPASRPRQTEHDLKASAQVLQAAARLFLEAAQRHGAAEALARARVIYEVVQMQCADD